MSITPETLMFVADREYIADPGFSSVSKVT